MVNDQKLVSASYIINFYNDLENLNTAYPVYNNELVYILSKYGGVDAGLSDEERNRLVGVANDIRSFILKTLIRYEALHEKINADVKLSDLKALADKITCVNANKTTNTMPERADIWEYIVLLNKAFTSAFMGELLLTSRSLLSGVS